MIKTAPSKAETALLEPFVGLELESIYTPRNRSEYIAATEKIMALSHVGFDTESRPTFKTGEVSRGPHVVQFALGESAYIFQLARKDCWQFVTTILESQAVLKVGFDLESDLRHIYRKLKVRPRSLVDLDRVFRRDGYRGNVGIRAAVGMVLNRKFHKSKKITTSNWARSQLTPGQLLYAANDAFAALQVFDALDKQKLQVLS